MLLTPNIKITTKWLTLQPVDDRYTDDILLHFTSEVTRYMPFTPQGNRDDVISFINESKTSLSKSTDLVMVAIDGNQEFIGCCGIHNIKESIELGLWLKKNAQSNGYGTEIITGLIEFLENNFTFKYILYPVDEENIASRRIPEKLGFTPFKRYQKNKNSTTDLHIIEYRKYYS